MSLRLRIAQTVVCELHPYKNALDCSINQMATSQPCMFKASFIIIFDLLKPCNQYLLQATFHLWEIMPRLTLPMHCPLQWLYRS